MMLSLLDRARGFTRSDRGVAAVEFALVLPVMLVMYFGLIEVTSGVSNDRKVTLLSRTLADLTGRMPTIDNTEMNSIFSAAAAVTAPYDPSQTAMVITSVAVRSNGGSGVEGRVCWSEARGPGASAKGTNTVIDVPDGFQTANTSYILAEVKAPYKPLFGYTITGTIDLVESTPWPVRNVKEVVRTGKPACLT